MIRFLLIVVAVWLAIMIARQLLRSDRSTASPRQLPERDMVRCTECGLHVPRNEAVEDQGRFYCSQRHHETHKSRQG